MGKTYIPIMELSTKSKKDHAEGLDLHFYPWNEKRRPAGRIAFFKPTEGWVTG